MTIDDRSRAGFSSAGSSGGDERVAAADSGTREAVTQRYRDRHWIGSGGMGDVHAAFDTLLGREVALKRMQRRDPEALSRLEHEARITAQLEHPNILPVLDTGVQADGVAFYTMPLVRGRALTAVAQEVSAAQDGGHAIVRRLLAVCEAAAFAHSRGVVHRDIKPSNILLGTFGETFLCDWGIAARAAGGHGAPRIGTAGFASPEQWSGAAPAFTDDVFALGQVLNRVVLHPPRALRAIIDRCVHPDAAARYPDAGELAADLRRYLDGQRVHAHRYSAQELLARFVWRFRLPLAVGGVLSLALALVLVSGSLRLRAENARARAAEQDARTALEQSTAMFASALEAAATRAFELGAHADAELLAAHALLRRESASARGVVSAARAGAVPVGRVANVPLAGCARVLDALHGRALCLSRRDVRTDERAPTLALVQVASGAQHAVDVGHHVVSGVLLREGFAVGFGGFGGAAVYNEEGRALVRVEASTAMASAVHASATGDFVVVETDRKLSGVALGAQARAWYVQPCGIDGRATMDAVAVGERHVAVACGTAEVRLLARDTGMMVAPPLPVPFGTSLRPASAAAFTPGEAELLLGGLGGEVARIAVANRTLIGVVTLHGGTVTSLISDGESTGVVTEGAGASLWNLNDRTELLRFPRSAGDAMHADEHGWHLAGVGRTLSLPRWSALGAAAPLWRADEGISAAVALEPADIVIGLGDGRVRRVARADGSVQAERHVARGAVKQLVTATHVIDGTQQPVLFAALSDYPGTAVLDAHTLEPVPGHAPSPGGARRVAAFADGDLWSVSYNTNAYHWDHPTAAPTRSSLVSPVLDIEMNAARTRAWMLDRAGAIHALDARGTATLRAQAIGAVAIASAGGGDTIVALKERALVIFDARGDKTFPLDPNPAGVELLDVAAAADGAWVVVGTSTGELLVIDARTGETRARMRAHTERVAQVAALDGALMMSAGWDGVVRFADASAFGAAAEVLVRDAEQRFGLTLAITLAGHAEPTLMEAVATFDDAAGPAHGGAADLTPF